MKRSVKKTEALYNGDSSSSGELLKKLTGFELQYDPTTGKIIKIKQDSWITKEQQRKNRFISKSTESDMILFLLENIDQSLLEEDLINLDRLDDLLIDRASERQP